MTDFNIRVEPLGESRVLRFAMEEWHSLYETAATPLAVQRLVLGTWKQLRQAEPERASDIAEDVEHYAKLGLHGMTNLVVPSRVEGYPYQWNQVFNSYAYARALWGETAEEILSRFAAFFDEELRPHVVMLFEQLEREMAVLTKWNVPFFPARAVDHPDATARSEADKEQVLRQLDRIIALAERYLAMGEIKHSHPLEQTLAHYVSYARQVKRQWQDLTPNA